MRELSADIVRPLLGWFGHHKRPLPWRQDREPYHVWISEIMLQQTRIEAVMKYYGRFMRALPDIQSLSRVDDDDLLKLWEGLGYYSRARNLKKAAAVIMRDCGGVFPKSCEQLRKLPGVGEYTAGAIASICFDERVPAVDGNVLRVITRVLGSTENVLLPKTKRDIAQQLTRIMPAQSGAFNEALMELGELVCLPNSAPDCPHCPVRGHCIAYRDDLTDSIPVRVKKIRRKREDKTVLLIRSEDGKTAIEKRPSEGLLSGMYQLPNTEGLLSEEEVTALVRDWQLPPVRLTRLKETKHVFTHIDWYMRGYRVEVRQPGDRFLWVSDEELRTAYPLPTAFQKFL